MAFIRDVFAQQPEKRRKINSTPSYTGGIFPVRPGTAASSLSIGASTLSLIGNYLTGRTAKGQKDGGGLMDAIIGGAKDVVRIGVQINEAVGGPVIQVPILFQYFPSSIEESRSSGVETTTTPGASLPVPTFSGPQPRNINMTVVFSREKWSPENPTLSPPDWDKYNVDVAVAVQALRAFSYPIGADTIGNPGFTPQPFMLSLPGTKIGIESDSIFCFLSSYSVTYDAFFPDGQPRLAHVQLAMQEMLIDLGQNVTGRSFRTVLEAYNRSAASIFTLVNAKEPIGKTTKMDVSSNRILK